ncbi:TRAP transporter large permease subunit, partial [candidate division KSB3 bacterium]|nr:TRAP transporter large permease subunit [candidate division KSB3 bacterium]MBD3325830.1 TRAP transporter large permease subunit [candidate division KSB3 bacterium]
VMWGIKAINWNVMGIFWGMLYITGIFIYSKVPVLLSDKLIEHAKNVGMAILAVCVLASFISAFVENVATVMIVAPIALTLCKQLRISPVPFLIGIAISSNLQGTATLIGDPPSMILAGAKQMNFNDFFVYQGKPGIFWAVQLGAIVSFLVLAYLFRNYRQPVGGVQEVDVLSWTPTMITVVMILCLALAPLVDPESKYLGGVICGGFGVGALLWYHLQHQGRWQKTKTFWHEYADWETFFFLIGIFLVVESVKSVGLIDDAAQWLTSTMHGNVFVTYTIIVWASVALSAVIDNVPYITAMIPLCQAVAANFGISDNVLVFGLLIGSCLGGNITPVGAAANVVSVGILKRNGYVIRFSEFIKIGLPFTVAATFASYVFVWVVWG